MESHSSLKGYSISGGRIPILVTLKKTSEVKPHEETVPEDLAKLVGALKENPVLRHPIIADQRTGIVLDGTHRLAAIQRLDCNFIPTALVDYDDRRISVERWFRKFYGQETLGLQNELERIGPQRVSRDECESGLSTRRWYATIESNASCLAFPTRNPDPCEMVRDSQKIENSARSIGVKIAYQDNKEVDSKDSEDLVMSTIKLSKVEVKDNVGRGKLFPPKSTRHLVPSRPLGAGVPLDWLQRTDYPEAQAHYQEFLMSRKIKRLPEGSRVGSRRYLEEVFLFE